jgi:hypothetical protein
VQGSFSVNTIGTPGASITWTASVTLVAASEDFTVDCEDSSGNVHGDTLTVTYTDPGCSDMGSGVICAVSDDTPSVGQALALTGFNLFKRTTTSWLGFFTANFNRYNFEGSNGANLTTLGYWQGVAEATPFGTITTARSILGASSVLFNASGTAPTHNPPASADNTTTGMGTSQSDFWISFYTQMAAPGTWPDAYIKPFFFAPNGSGALLQPINSSPAGGSATWQCFMGGGAATFTFSPDGGVPIEDEWYEIHVHIKVTAPTNCTVIVNGVQRLNTSALPVGGASELMTIGFVNADSQGRNFNVNTWMDALVISSAQIRSPAQVWACDQNTDDPRTSPETKGCVYQFLTHIADNQIDFAYRNVGNGVTLTSSVTAYLFAINQAGELSGPIAYTTP